MSKNKALNILSVMLILSQRYEKKVDADLSYANFFSLYPILSARWHIGKGL